MHLNLCEMLTDTCNNRSLREILSIDYEAAVHVINDCMVIKKERFELSSPYSANEFSINLVEKSCVSSVTQN